jgi:acyl-[acyl-carrier-protein]-phospholipid O-acyltransferase/long-chain-fatty-acid--[acyl-carrier-protein] ligase
VLLSTPTFLANYARFAHAYDFRSVRYVIAGAEKLTEPVRKTWSEKFGLRILEGYGATECAPVIAVNTPQANRADTVGQLLPGIEHVLTPVSGIDGGGRLQVKGPNVMVGYLLYSQPGKIVDASAKQGCGWYDTGDIVDVDPEGFVSIKGRVKRFAKIAGEMVSLEHAENLAFAASPAAMHAATVKPDAAKGEALVLFTTDASLTVEHLRQAADKTGTTLLAVPRDLRLVDSVPLLGTGKVDYVRLKTMV